MPILSGYDIFRYQAILLLPFANSVHDTYYHSYAQLGPKKGRGGGFRFHLHVKHMEYCSGQLSISLLNMERLFDLRYAIRNLVCCNQMVGLTKCHSYLGFKQASKHTTSLATGHTLDQMYRCYLNVVQQKATQIL